VDDRERVLELGMRVRLARVRNRWSQQQLADESGVSRVTVGSIERGDHAAGVLAVWKLADALGVPIADLLE
jgi:transcriptional regulator with XRE-family HTH domain